MRRPGVVKLVFWFTLSGFPQASGVHNLPEDEGQPRREEVPGKADAGDEGGGAAPGLPRGLCKPTTSGT